MVVVEGDELDDPDPDGGRWCCEAEGDGVTEDEPPRLPEVELLLLEPPGWWRKIQIRTENCTGNNNFLQINYTI